MEIAKGVARGSRSARALLAQALAAAIVIASAAGPAVAPARACDWSNPGADRYTGTTRAALARYKDLPREVQDELGARMERHDYDDKVMIGAVHVQGESFAYADEVWGMHFGSGKMCSSLNRSSLRSEQAALVYTVKGHTVKGHTVVVPSICGNIARARRLGPAASLEPAAPLEMSPSAGRPPGAVAESEKSAEAAPQTPSGAAGPVDSFVGGLEPAAWKAAPAGLVQPAEAAPLDGWGGLPGLPWQAGAPGGWTPAGPGLDGRAQFVGAAPEPGTWALMLVGLAGLGWSTRRPMGKGRAAAGGRGVAAGEPKA